MDKNKLNKLPQIIWFGCGIVWIFITGLYFKNGAGAMGIVAGILACLCLLNSYLTSRKYVEKKKGKNKTKGNNSKGKNSAAGRRKA